MDLKKELSSISVFDNVIGLTRLQHSFHTPPGPLHSDVSYPLALVRIPVHCCIYSLLILVTNLLLSFGPAGQLVSPMSSVSNV